ncbi:MAG: hypothetical protein HZA16_06710 [Nitrospirae bacterium]|nr:hypothetical protein [Nitrospirota bacterium]
MNKAAVTIPLDVLSANRATAWVDDFIWPVNSLELLAVRKDIEMILYSLLQKEEDELLLSVLRVAFNRLVVEHLSLTNAMLVIKGVKGLGYGMDASCQGGQFGLLKGLTERGVPERPIFLPDTLRRRSIKNCIRSVVKASKRSMSLNPGSKGYPLLMTGGLAEEISGTCAGTFQPMDPYDLFSRVAFSNGNGNCRGISGLAEKATEEILSYWTSRRISAGRHMRDYVYGYHYQHFFRTSCFLNAAKNSHMLQGRDVWVGSGGVFFHRLIGELGKKRGSRVSFHDHAESKALYDTTNHGYSQLGLCDRFVTYTGSCAELYEKGWRSSVAAISEEMPQIDVSAIGCGRFFQDLVGKSEDEGIRIRSRKVMYVSGAFTNDLNFFANRPHDMVYFEWQNAMLKAVKEMGYSVGVKYHPETLFIKSSLMLGDSVEYLQGRFQDYLDRDDILLFDTTCSTALQIALCCSNPLVLIYCPVNEIHESVLEDLAGRAEIVRGFFDDRNRFRVDLDRLAAALENCDKAKSHDFARKYYVAHA